MPTKIPPLTSDWMRVGEAAARMGCCPQTVRNRLRTGLVPVRWTTIAGIIHINRAHFAAWVNGDREAEKQPA